MAKLTDFLDGQRKFIDVQVNPPDKVLSPKEATKMLQEFKVPETMPIELSPPYQAVIFLEPHSQLKMKGSAIAHVQEGVVIQVHAPTQCIIVVEPGTPCRKEIQEVW